MEKPELPVASRFVDEIRSLYAQNLYPDILWSKVRVAMEPLLADPALKESSKTWPLTVEGAPKVKNLLFYEDPDYGFVFNATVRKANSITSIHDHGDAHGSTGFCSAVRVAWAKGKIIKNVFVADSFVLVGD